MLRRLFSLFAALALLMVSGCTGGDMCTCNLADVAVVIEVFDELEDSPVDDFAVEVIQNGQPIGEPPGCIQGFREEGNSCGFGDETGIYHVTVLSPGYQSREFVVRVAAEEDSELCCRARLSAKLVTVRLKR